MKRTAVIAAAILVLIIAGALIAGPFVGDANFIDEVHWQGTPLAPCFQSPASCGAHVLGTDENGRDILARLVIGTRFSLGIAVVALLIEVAIAAILASLARASGFIGILVRWISDGVSALPRLPMLLLFALIMYALHDGHHGDIYVYRGPTPLLIAAWLGVLLWPRATLLLREAAPPGVVARRVIADLTTLVLLGATLDFFGFGVYPPNPSWGNMLANAESNLEVAWWASVFPGVCIIVTALLLDVIRRGIRIETSA